MRGKECEGSITFADGSKSEAVIQTWSNRSIKWYKARGTLILDIQNLPQKPPGRWHVGIFYCGKHPEEMQDHIYSISATDHGSIEKSDKDSVEKIRINVAVTRIAEEGLHARKPKVQRLND